MPSPDEPEEGTVPSSKYALLADPYKAYQDCQAAASGKEAIAETQKWSEEIRYNGLRPLPTIDRNYRKSVVAQRKALRPIAEWHSTVLPEKLEAHLQYAEETQTYLRDYLTKSSKSTSDLVKAISTAQKKLAEFSSLAFIDPSQKCFENESSHPLLQPAIYLNHGLGGVPAEPVLGVLSYHLKLLKVESNTKPGFTWLNVRRFLEAEKESTSFDEVIQRLKERYDFTQSDIAWLVLYAISPLLPVGDDAIRRYRNGIKREELASLLKPFPIENCRMASTLVARLEPPYNGFYYLAEWILGSAGAGQLLEDIWRKWDFENHRPLPREVVRNRPEWDYRTKLGEGGKLIIKRTRRPYKSLQ